MATIGGTARDGANPCVIPLRIDRRACEGQNRMFHSRPEWRNGKRAGLKIQWPQGRVGSSPTSGTRGSMRTWIPWQEPDAMGGSLGRRLIDMRLPFDADDAKRRRDILRRRMVIHHQIKELDGLHAGLRSCTSAAGAQD